MEMTPWNRWEQDGEKPKDPRDPIFRKALVPWYDTDVCILITLTGGLAGLVFSMFGIATAWDEPTYLPHIWVPCLLGLLCLVIVISTMTRLYRRWTPEAE